MKKIIFIIAFCAVFIGCNKINAMLDMPDKMDSLGKSTADMSHKMDDTNENIRLQKLLLTVQEFSKSENFNRLFPVPTGLLVPAQKFAESATVEELVKFTYVQLKYIDKNLPEARVDVNGEERELTSDEIWQAAMEKFAMLQALKAVAAQIPDQTVSSMVSSEIVGRSRFQSTALQILAMRADFVSNIFLKESALDTKDAGFDTAKHAEEALKYQNQVEWILKLPFRKYISVKTEGILLPLKYKGDLQNYQFNLSEPKTIKLLAGRWKDIRVKCTYSLKVEQKDWSGNASQDKKNFEDDMRLLTSILAIATGKEQEWAN